VHTLKGEHVLSRSTGDPLKAHGFDTRAYEDDFFRSNALRSGYLSEANVDAARIYVSGGVGWYGPGWYWDPWFRAYAGPGRRNTLQPFWLGFLFADPSVSVSVLLRLRSPSRVL
jgi:hypothetical protein